MLGVMVARLPKERKADALSKLEAVESNVWVATASPSGDVHLVPVTHTWNGSQVVLATEPTSRTVANVTANPRARLALGESRDVVMIDAALVEAVPASEAPAPLARREMTEELKRLLSCLGKLDPEKQRIVLLAYYSGWSRDQLAQKLDIPVNTIKTWLRRSLIEIRECMGN